MGRAFSLNRGIRRHCEPHERRGAREHAENARRWNRRAESQILLAKGRRETRKRALQKQKRMTYHAAMIVDARGRMLDRGRERGRGQGAARFWLVTAVIWATVVQFEVDRLLDEDSRQFGRPFASNFVAKVASETAKFVR